MGGLSGKFLDARQTIGFGIESRLETTNRRGAVLEHLVGHSHPFGLELVQGNDSIHQAHVQGLIRAITAAEEPDLPSLALAHDSSQIPRTKATIKTADSGSCLTEDSVIRREAEITEEMKHLPSPDRVARHQSDHNLGQAANDPLQIKNIQPWETVVAHVPPVASHALVASGAKSMGTVWSGTNSREQHHADVAVIADPAEGITELSHGLGPKGIAFGWAVDRNASDALRATIEKNVLIRTPGLPHNAGITGEHLGRLGHQLQSSGSAFWAAVRSAVRSRASASRSVQQRSRAGPGCASPHSRADGKSSRAATLRPGTPWAAANAM